MCDVRSTALEVGSPSYEGDLQARHQPLTACASDQPIDTRSDHSVEWLMRSKWSSLHDNEHEVWCRLQGVSTNVYTHQLLCCVCVRILLP